MSIVKIPMDNPEAYEKGGLPIEPGTREFEIKNVPSIKTAKTEKGTKYVDLQLVCVADDDMNGRTLYDNIALTEKSYYRFYQFCRACGFTDEEIKEGVDVSVLQGTRLIVTSEQRPDTYQGETRMRAVVKKYEYDVEKKG